MTTLDKLMVEIHQGSEDALRRLMCDWNYRFEQLAVKLVNDESVAEEIVQEAVIAIWRKRGQFDETCPAWPWIARIIRNRCYEWWRKQGARRKDGIETTMAIDDAWFIACSAPTPYQNSETRDLVTTAKKRIYDLPPNVREIVQLWLFAEMTEAEIAEELGVPVGTVKSTKHRALTTLRKFLDRRII